MDEPSALDRAERTFWTVWNYISGAVTRFMRSQPAGNNPGNVDREQTDGHAAGLERADVDPSQRNDEEQEEGEEEEEEKKKEEEEQSDLNTASLPRPPVDLPPGNDTLLLESARSGDVQCTSEPTRWGGSHSRPVQRKAQVQWLIQTEPPSITPNAATQQTIEPENHETLLGVRGETKTEESDKPQKQQQETAVSGFSDEENDHKHSGLVKEIEETLAADRPEQEAVQDSKVTEEEKALPRGEDTDLNGPNNASGLGREGLHIVTEETCANEEHLERRGGGGGGDAREATSTNPENTDGGSAEPSTLPEEEHQPESHLESSELDLSGNVSDEDRDEKADQEITTTVSVTPSVESPELSLSSFRSDDDSGDDNAIGKERLEVEAEQSVEEVQSELKEYSSDLIEGEVCGEGSETSEEEAPARVPVHVEETLTVHSQDRYPRDDSLPQEDVTQTEAEEEEKGEAAEISDTLQMARDMEPSHSMNAEAEPEPSGPEHRLCPADTRSRERRDSLSASGPEDGEGGGLGAQGAAGIDSPGGAVAGKAESNNEQEMSTALPDVSPGTAQGSGAGPGGLNHAAPEETRCLTPGVNNDRPAVSSGDTEQIALMGRDSAESWVTSRSPRASGGFKYVAGEGERAQGQREDRDATLRNGGTEDATVADAGVTVGGSVDPESLVHSEVPWGSTRQSSGTAVQATGEEEEEEEEGSTGEGLSDEKCSGREAHKTDLEDLKTEEPLFDFTLDGERSESEVKVVSQSAVRSSVRCDEVTAQEDGLFGEKTPVLPDAAILTTTEVWDVESGAVAMTEEYKGRTPRRSEDDIEPRAPQSIGIDLSFSDDGEKNMEDIDADFSDDAMGKGASHAGPEENTESAAEPNQSLVDSIATGSLTDMTPDFLMELSHPDEPKESTHGVAEPQTTIATQEVEEHVEVVSAVNAADALGVLPGNTDRTPAMVSQTGTRSTSSLDGPHPDDEAADKISKMLEPPHRQPNSEEQIQGAQDEKLPLEAYPCDSGSSRIWGISDILEPQGRENSEHTSGRERLSEDEVTTEPEPVRLPEMLSEAHPGVPDAPLHHSFTERPPSPEQEPQHHHPPQSYGKLSDHEAPSSQADPDESSNESHICEETEITVETVEVDPEVSEVAVSDDRAAEDGRDETSAIPVPTPDHADGDCMKPAAEDTSHLPPETKVSDPGVPAEVDSVVMREKKGFGASRRGLDSQHPLHKLSLINQALSRRSEFIPSPVAALSAEERARQRHSLPPGDQFELDVSALDFTAQKSRILVKNPITRKPTDPRALLERPSLEPSPSQPSGSQRALPLGARPFGGIGPGIKLPGLGMGFPALKKTPKVVKEVEAVPEESEPQPGTTTSPKPTVAERKPRWTPPKQPGFANPLMSELKSKLKKTSEE